MNDELLELLKGWIYSPQVVVLDTETTGLDDQAEVIEISVMDMRGKVLFDQLVRPLNPVPDEATDIHGITNDSLASKPNFPDVYLALRRVISGKTVVAYNASFDNRLLMQTCAAYGLPMIEADWQCAMDAYSRYRKEPDAKRGGYRRQSLAKAAKQMGIEVYGAHRAVADCFTTVEVIGSVYSKLLAKLS
ncbi:3'-5' exonuclease [Hahella sp. KA22]|uniref:3'-5' exonuclease n=1 Tax=Hahella sp. KA22 TaxID=1628392 RepID=UPI000FDD5506|nr:3'-5' exonuclease [Hahella sp. KA22]AZZ94702.1 3'-5' exonuclease [Hahella sp. KA22]QAY58075.1 3'-5' exonuclease [Hahella sp. KA22]